MGHRKKKLIAKKKLPGRGKSLANGQGTTATIGPKIVKFGMMFDALPLIFPNPRVVLSPTT